MSKKQLLTRQNNLLHRKDELEREIYKLIRFIRKNLFSTYINTANSVIQRCHHEVIWIDKTLGEIAAKIAVL